VKLLLDTHVALWAVIDKERLPSWAAELIVDPSNDVRVSIVSLWEIAIKNSLRAHRAGVGVTVPQAMQMFQATSFSIHPLEPHHLTAYEEMTVRGGDPFDRVIFAQADADGLSLMTHDPRIAAFEPERVLKV